MAVDLTKFPYNGVSNPYAASLTEAIAADPVDGGFIVVTLKSPTSASLISPIRDFAHQVRAASETTGLVDITAYRQIHRDEMGGNVPFDQAFCETILDDIAARKEFQSGRFPGLAATADLALHNTIADWVLMITYASAAQATAAAEALRSADSPLSSAFPADSVRSTINVFQNMKQYAHVSLDPDAIQFFNLFPGPGDPEGLWVAWQEVLPRYFDAAEIRSSFPLKALDAGQPLILVNYAHADSMKHFLLSMAFDPNFLEDIQRCYVGRGFAFPHPFFCKVVPV